MSSKTKDSLSLRLCPCRRGSKNGGSGEGVCRKSRDRKEQWKSQKTASEKIQAADSGREKRWRQLETKTNVGVSFATGGAEMKDVVYKGNQ